MDPLSAFSKGNGWAVPDFSLEARRPKHARTLPALAFAPRTASSPFRPPDEEKGRAFRSPSQSNLSSTLFGAPDPAAAKFAQPDEAVIEPLASGLAQALELNADEEDDLFEAWHAGGGAAAHDDSGYVEEDPPSCFARTTPSPPLPASAAWTRAIDYAVLNADGNIQLSGQKLGMVPNAVWELSTLRSFTPSSPSRTLSRTQSVPAANVPSSPTPHRIFGRTSTVPFGSPTSSAPFAAATVGVVLMLSGNELTTASLSNALWTLPNLQVLSLRNNLLDTLPEGIGRLHGLRELSLAQNQLRFLPAEILQLENLANLTLHPNPFLPPPAAPALGKGEPATDAALPRPRRSRRVLGPLFKHFAVPSLGEICTRILLSPAPSSSPPASLSSSTSRSGGAPATRHIHHVRGGVEALRTVLPAGLFAPFHSTFYPPSSLAASSSAAASSFARTRFPSGASAAPGPGAQPFDPLSHVCRSPSHAPEARVFVRPAVERIEWVSEARLRAGRAGRGAAGREVEVRDVPIRWRGCGAGCLDWLEEEEDERGEVFEAGRGMPAAERA